MNYGGIEDERQKGERRKVEDEKLKMMIKNEEYGRKINNKKLADGDEDKRQMNSYRRSKI